MSDIVKNTLRFLILVCLIQVLILNGLTLRWWTNPYGFPIFVPLIYPLFILLLPFQTPVWLLLLTGFVTGLVVDMSINTVGIHAMATVLIAYLRTNVLTALVQKNLSEYPNQSPNVKNMGWIPFLTYSSFLILMHHAVFFTVEMWTLSNITMLLLKILASGITSMLFILAYLLLFTRQATLKG